MGAVGLGQGWHLAWGTFCVGSLRGFAAFGGKLDGAALGRAGVGVRLRRVLCAMVLSRQGSPVRVFNLRV